VQTEKLASLGRMSAGIIHEINNPLNFATTGLFTLRNKGKYLAPEQQAEYAEILQGRRGGHQTREDDRLGPAHVHAPDTESSTRWSVGSVGSLAVPQQ
jgi:signal transduction histidine kinase